MFKEYRTVQKSKIAAKILPAGTLEKVSTGIAKYTIKSSMLTKEVEFTYSEDAKPEVGGYIVKGDSCNTFIPADKFDRTYKPVGSK